MLDVNVWLFHVFLMVFGGSGVLVAQRHDELCQTIVCRINALLASVPLGEFLIRTKEKKRIK